MFSRIRSKDHHGRGPEAPRPGENAESKAQLVALEAISARHSAHVTIMWQAPGLALAAEAFLLTIALAPDSSVAARITASIVGVLVALLASQFMATHRHASQRDGRILQELVDRLDLADVMKTADEVKAPWLSRRSSYFSWRIGLGILMVANLGILIVSIVHPGILTGPSACS